MPVPTLSPASRRYWADSPTVQRSAGFQPAVSPISNRQTATTFRPTEDSMRLQVGTTAIRQVGNLRYEPVQPQSAWRGVFLAAITWLALVSTATAHQLS